MWSSERRGFLALLAGLPLAACGFSPAYGPGGPGQALRSQVRAADPSSALDFAFVGALEDRLGRPQVARFALAYDIAVEERGGARVRDVGDTRFQVFGQVSFALTDATDGTEVSAGTAQNFTAYSATSTQLATRMAQQDAERRLMGILADQVVTRLLAVLPANPAP